MSTLSEGVAVLYAGEDPAIPDLLSTALERRVEQVSVGTATSVADALARLDGSDVDCVVSDHEPPGFDGIEFLRRVRDTRPDLPLILFSDSGSDVVASRAFAAGADGYLRRGSIDDQYAVLAERIGTLVDRRRVRQQDARRVDAARIESSKQLDWFRTVVEALDDPVYVLDGEGRFEFVNEAFVETFGYDREEVIGADTSIVKSPEVVQQGEEYLGRILSSGGPDSVRFEAEIQAKDGTSIPCEDHMGVLPYEGKSFEGSVGMLRDITEQRRRERELQRRNRRLDEFASVVSHDLRNPLNVATGRTELAREECDSDHLDAVNSAHERMETLIEDLLVLAQEGDAVGDTEPVDLDGLAEQCYETVETGDATIRTRTDRSILADRSRLKQLLENLVRNSIEHGSTGPHSQARGDSVEHGSTSSRTESDDSVEHSSTSSRTKSDDDITITVGELDDGFYIEDDGPGIPADERGTVFDPGYTTSDDGTGFGLAIVRQIADAHGWEIRATEGTAGGARFEMTGVEFVE